MTSGRKFANLSHRLLGGEQYLLITSELTNQSMRKALFTCVVYTNEHYSPPTEWIMHDPSKNKMASVNSHFRNQKSWEYKKYSTKIAVKFGLKVFKGEERLTNIQLSSSIRTCPWHSQISSIKAKPTTKSLFTQHWQKWILQGSLAETSSAIKQSIFMSLYKKTFSFPPKSCTHFIFWLILPQIFISSEKENFDWTVNWFCSRLLIKIANLNAVKRPFCYIVTRIFSKVN